MQELTPEVREALKAKCPHAQPVDPDVLIQESAPMVNPILFKTLTVEVVCVTALAIRGVAGPSMGDSYVWRRMLVSFKSASQELCEAVAEVSHHLATNHVNP